MKAESTINPAEIEPKNIALPSPRCKREEYLTTSFCSTNSYTKLNEANENPENVNPANKLIRIIKNI